MSRIGVQPIRLPPGVTLRVEEGVARVKGPKGEMARRLPEGLRVEAEPDRVRVIRPEDRPDLAALHGTIRSLLANMVRGVSEGYLKELEIEGVGYRAQLNGNRLDLSIGRSHTVEFPVPQGLSVEVSDGVRIAVRGIDKQQVGEAAARIRAFYKAEPYKGKGIRYKGERVRRKAGKTVA